MTTIKSYTDIEQSKKLAEILPFESADMWYEDCGLMIPRLGHMPKEHTNTEVPCWSLVALLCVLHDYTLQTNTDGTVFVVCENKKPMISDAYDNPVDACVNMIIKLSELKML